MSDYYYFTFSPRYCDIKSLEYLNCCIFGEESANVFYRWPINEIDDDTSLSHFLETVYCGCKYNLFGKLRLPTDYQLA